MLVFLGQLRGGLFGFSTVAKGTLFSSCHHFSESSSGFNPILCSAPISCYALSMDARAIRKKLTDWCFLALPLPDHPLPARLTLIAAALGLGWLLAAGLGQ